MGSRFDPRQDDCLDRYALGASFLEGHVPQGQLFASAFHEPDFQSLPGNLGLGSELGKPPGTSDRDDPYGKAVPNLGAIRFRISDDFLYFCQNVKSGGFRAHGSHS